MSKRTRDRSDLMNVPSTGKTISELEAIDRAIYGDILSVDATRQVAEPTDIFSIHPDPSQPRRSVPSQVRAVWDGRSENVPAMLQTWWDMVNAERGKFFDLDGILRQKSELLDEPELDHESDNSGPLETGFLKLINLAASIRRDGLTNAITVVIHGSGYQIETGERRWLAYHLLYAWSQKDDFWVQMPARIVEKFDVWRQASENNARDNLNAIGKARQFALLLMDIHRKIGHKFLTFDEATKGKSCDRAFYAQVSDGRQYPVPANLGHQILNAIGLKNPQQLRDYRSVLRIPDMVWQIADDLSWAEFFIRDMREKSKGDAELFVRAALTEAKLVGYEVPGSSFQHEDLFTHRPRKPTAFADLLPGSRKYFNEMCKIIRVTGKGKDEKNNEAIRMIHDLRDWLDQEENRIHQYQDE